MTRSTRKVRQAIIFSAALALVAAGLAYAGQDNTVKKSFKVEPGGKLVLDTDIGSVEVRGAPAGAVDITVEREVRNGHDEKVLDDFKLNFEQRGNDVYVTGEYDKHGLSRLFDNLWNKIRIRFVITVPSAYSADLRTSGGGIAVKDLEGEVASKTSGGSLHFDKITGNVRGSTSGGSIEAGFVDGDVDVRTSGGHVSTDFPVTIQGEIDRSSLQAKINGGGPELYLRTSGGGIHIKKR